MFQGKDKGERTEAIVLAEFVKQGRAVLIPFGDNQRYDLVIDEGGGSFIRIQCKTGRLVRNHIQFNAYSTEYSNKLRSYEGEVEAFAVHCPDNDKIYLVPIEDVKTRKVRLQLSVPKFSKYTDCLMAEDYEF